MSISTEYCVACSTHSNFGPRVTPLQLKLVVSPRKPMATHEPLISRADGIRPLSNDSVSSFIDLGWSAQGRFCGMECCKSSTVALCCGNHSRNARQKRRHIQ